MEMIERVYAPADWYPRYSKTQLSSILQAGLQALQESSSSRLKWEADLNLLLAACRAIQPPLERAYALLLISKAAAQRDETEKAQALLAEGLSQLKDRNENQAFLEWVLGSVEWWQRSGISGFKHWKNTMQTLDLLAKEAVKNHQDEKAAWLKDCAAKLADLVVEMTGSVKGGYLLFNRYSKSKLSKVTYDLVLILRGLAEKEASEAEAQKRASEAEKVIQTLDANTRFSEEYPEAMVECGVAAYETGDVAKAVKYFRKAQLKYLADRENLLAVSWMLAAAQGYLESEMPNSLKNWQACEKLLKDLSVAVDRMKDEHAPEKKQWFGVLTELLNKLPG
jgi:hypothetical protein